MSINWFCNLMLYQNLVWSILLLRMKFELDYGFQCIFYIGLNLFSYLDYEFQCIFRFTIEKRFVMLLFFNPFEFFFLNLIFNQKHMIFYDFGFFLFSFFRFKFDWVCRFIFIAYLKHKKRSYFFNKKMLFKTVPNF